MCDISEYEKIGVLPVVHCTDATFKSTVQFCISTQIVYEIVTRNGFSIATVNDWLL